MPNLNFLKNKILNINKENYGFILMIFSILLLFLFLYFNPHLLNFNSDTLIPINESIILNTSIELYLNYYNQSLDSIDNIFIEIKDNIYNVHFDISDSEPVLFYFTLDGEFLLDVYDLDELIYLLKPLEEDKINKSDKPIVDFYIMSICPYSNRAEGTLFPVYHLLGDKVAWNFHYIIKKENESFNTFYGFYDTSQTIREICVLKKYGLDYYVSFVNYTNYYCGGSALCWEEGIKQLKLNLSEINSCYDLEGYDILNNEYENLQGINITKSPTMFINNLIIDVVYNYDDSEGYKKLICSAFNSPPEECNIVIN